MKTKAWIAVTVALVAASVGGTWLATAQDTAAPAAKVKIHVFEVEGRGSAEMSDVGAKGPSAGDAFLENLDLVDPADATKKLGQTFTRADVVRILPGDDIRMIVSCTVDLAAGRIHFVGGADFSEFETGATFPVSGGTGAYSGVRGTITIKAGELTGGVKGYNFTFDLLKG